MLEGKIKFEIKYLTVYKLEYYLIKNVYKYIVYIKKLQ